MRSDTQSPEAVLEAAEKTGFVRDAGGAAVPVQSAIAPGFSRKLRDVTIREQPRLALEIGMAQGFSTLAILSGLPAGGRLISIDPFQHSQFGGTGVAQVARTDRAAAHRLIEEPDYLALPKLVEQGLPIDLAYVDGMHTFDYVLLDAFYIDKLLRVGGVIGFNDCGFRSIHKFLRFFRSHRQYRELDVGLPRDFRGASPAKTLARRITGRSNQDRYFRKLADWEPEHNFFRRF